MVQQDYLPLEDFGAGGGWTGTDYLPLLTGDSFDSGLLPPGKGKERSSSNDMDHEASDLSSLDDGGEESGHEHDAADGTAPPPAATQPRKKSKSEADKTKARLGEGRWRVGQRRWGRGGERRWRRRRRGVADDLCLVGPVSMNLGWWGWVALAVSLVQKS